jgi:D-cysteine desulfhydrase family pyridoxal phosphate-dependent enzyme
MIEPLKIAHLPTPIEDLPRLTEALGGPRIMIKRDDQTGLASGGNKTRKMEYLLADALGKGAQTVITAGAVQSNHCRQTAAAAARVGLNCILVLAGDPPESPGGNYMLDMLFGAQIKWTTWGSRDETLQQVFDEAISNNEKPYLIPYGGSNPIGASAYALAMQELMQQGTEANWIVLASSSAGTQAGMVVGAKLFGYEGRVLGISIDKPAEALSKMVADLASGTAAYLGEDFTVTPEDVLVNADYLGDGYGVLNEGEISAVRLFARSEGILLDPVYTGRAAYGMIDLIKRDFFDGADTVLFWHTGGMPALFASQYSELLS